MAYRLLFYDYVPDILERRDPFRPEHLANVRTLMADGTIVLAGATGEPPDGAVIIFQTDDATLIDRFVAADPYVQNGLVTGWRVKPWAVVPPA
jgi:uncharacterized protein YciI